MLELPFNQRDGLWGSITDSAIYRFRAVAYLGSNKNMAWVQRVIDVTPDGVRGPKTNAALKKWVAEFQQLLRISDDGVWGKKTDAAFVAFRKANLNKF
jgi:lysozyme family protein